MRSPRLHLLVATFLCLAPVTLMVPGLHELVVVAHGGSDRDAHAFMSVNMVAGMIAVPVVLAWLRRTGRDVTRWAAAALVIDAVAFAGMAWAPSLPVLMAFRVLDGMAHLPAITLLMVAGSRSGAQGQGGTMGALASSIMVGVAVGSPLGGRLVPYGPPAVYLTGALLLLVGAAVLWLAPAIAPGPAPARGRYRWQRTPVTWIPLGYAFLDRFSVGIFVSTFTLYLTRVAGLGPAERGLLVALFMGPFALLCYPAGRLAERVGWLRPLLAGNILFGATFALYGVVPVSWLPVLMVASGVFSALMFAPALLLVSDLARREAGDGLFGAFQMAGSLGFLVGPIAGGVLVSLSADTQGEPAWAMIFAGVGLLSLTLATITQRAFRAPRASLSPVLHTVR